MGVAVRMAVLEALSRNFRTHTMMLSDRRPILLANARIVDPLRDLDIVGDLLIADGVMREAKKGIGAAGVPEGTDVIDCRGKLIAPGIDRHAGVHRRAGRSRPGNARFGQPRGRSRWCYNDYLPAGNLTSNW